MTLQLDTAKQLVALAQRYLDHGDAIKAAQAIAQAEEIVTQAAQEQVLKKPAQS